MTDFHVSAVADATTGGAITAVVIVGGEPLPTEVAALLPTDALYIAADSGLDHALAAGLRPSILVGDCDSISSGGLQWAADHNVEILTFPADKDFTDAEAALATAHARGASTIIMVSGGGDRLDHTLGAITALGHATLDGCHLWAYWGTSAIRVLHGPATVQFSDVGDCTFSLLALHGDVVGVTLSGARFALTNEGLRAGSSRGVSNETVADRVSVAVSRGVLTIIFPNKSISNGGVLS